MSYTQEEVHAMPVVTMEDVKCPICGEPMRIQSRFVDAWDDPPRPIEMEVYLACTCIPPKDFEL